MSFNIEKTVRQVMSFLGRERKDAQDWFISAKQYNQPILECFKINSKHFQMEKTSQK